ncbi:hypothetical protein Tco_0642361 [Tanacetum coccineum]
MLTTVHDKTEGAMQSAYVSSNFTSKLLNLDNTDPDVNEIASLMNTSTVPPPPPPVNPSSHLTTIPQQQTPNSTTTTTNLTMTLLEIPNFASLFQFDQKVSALETKMSEFNQTNQFAKVVSSIPGIVDQYLASKMKEAVDVTIWVQSNKLKEEAKAENQELFNQVDSTMKAIIKEHVKAQVSKIMPQIEKYLTESLGAKVLNLYNELVEAYNSDKDIITSYGDVVTLKRGRDDQDKDEYPYAGSDRGTKRIKSSKDAEPSKGSKSKESKSSSSSKGTQSQPKSSDDQPDNEVAPKHDWFQKPDKPPTPYPRQPPRTFDELMGTPIDFSACVMNRLKIDNLTQDILVGLAFNLLKGSCKSFAEIKYHFKECYKVVNDRIDWHNLEGREHPFNLNKPLSLIKDRGRQVVPADYFINNDLEYLKGRSSSSKYVTSTTNKTKLLSRLILKDGRYGNKTLWSQFYAYACHWKSLHDVYSKRRIIAVTSVKVMRWYDYGYLEEIVVRRDDNKKLSNLDVDDRYDLGVALRMFTRRIVILHRVEDLQLGSVLNDIASNLEMDYLPKRYWSNMEMKRSRIMVKAIDKMLFERRLMRNLEKFVGGRDYGNDLSSIYTDQQGTVVIATVFDEVTKAISVDYH